MSQKKILYGDVCFTDGKSKLVLLKSELDAIETRAMSAEKNNGLQERIKETIKIFIEHDKKEIIKNVIKSTNIPDNLKVLVVDSVPSNIGEIADLNGYLTDRLYFKKICKNINEKDIVESTVKINPFNKFVRQRKKGKVKRW